MTFALIVSLAIAARLMGISADDFRAALGRWASGVTVVTCASGQELHGMTVSAFASVSLVPPLVSVCLANDARALAMIRDTGWFAVNVLSAAQAGLSNHFASSATEASRLAGISHRPSAQGLPWLDAAAANLECRATALHPAGDHTLVVGEVCASLVSGAEPLVYCAGQYGAFKLGE